MIPRPFEYYAPASVPDALGLLKKYGDEAKLLAGGHIVVPMVGDRRGNPIVLDEVAIAKILASEMNLGCRHLIEQEPELVSAHRTDNHRFTTDLDTLDDVQQLAESTGWRFELPPLESISVS